MFYVHRTVVHVELSFHHCMRADEKMMCQYVNGVRKLTNSCILSFAEAVRCAVAVTYALAECSLFETHQMAH